MRPASACSGEGWQQQKLLARRLSTYGMLKVSAALFALRVASINFPLLLQRRFSFCVVSLGVAVHVEDVSRAQRPLEVLVHGAVAAHRRRLVIGGGLFRGRSLPLVLRGF